MLINHEEGFVFYRFIFEQTRLFYLHDIYCMFMFFWFIDIYVATSITLKKSEEAQLNVYMYLNLAPMKIPY